MTELVSSAEDWPSSMLLYDKALRRSTNARLDGRQSPTPTLMLIQSDYRASFRFGGYHRACQVKEVDVTPAERVTDVVLFTGTIEAATVLVEPLKTGAEE